jgi:hypothetical protein
MNTRKLRHSDYTQARALCENQKFPCPDFDEVSLATVVDTGSIIGVGFIRTLHEAIIAIDQNQSKATRTKAFKAIIRQGAFESAQVGISEWHCFVEDPKVKLLLKKSFGFTDVKGDPLRVEF